MELWLITRNTKEEKPNRAQQMLVAAKHSAGARELAAQSCWDEGPEVWRTSQGSRATRLGLATKDNLAGVIMISGTKVE